VTKTTPLRTPASRQEFCAAYFQAVGASEVYNAPDYREYRLPPEIDKELTDRPYYWLWVEQTGQLVEPTTLRLAFTDEALTRENRRLHDEAWAQAERTEMSEIERMFFRPPTAELISLGSFRLEKIFESLGHRGRFACVTPDRPGPPRRIVPWLMVNILISFRADLTEQEYRSLAICLENGQMVDGFYDAIARIPMSPSHPDALLQPKHLPLSTAFAKLHSRLMSELEAGDFTWAEQARRQLETELDQIDLYYESILPDLPESEHSLAQAEQARKRRELCERSEPRVVIEYKQAALVGLHEAQVSKAH
jgi:hypothetical protein